MLIDIKIQWTEKGKLVDISYSIEPEILPTAIVVLEDLSKKLQEEFTKLISKE